MFVKLGDFFSYISQKNYPKSKTVKKSNFDYTRGITPKRVTSGGPISAAQRLGNTAPNKRRSGGEPLATLCPSKIISKVNYFKQSSTQDFKHIFLS